MDKDSSPIDLVMTGDASVPNSSNVGMSTKEAPRENGGLVFLEVKIHSEYFLQVFRVSGRPLQHLPWEIWGKLRGEAPG